MLKINYTKNNTKYNKFENTKNLMLKRVYSKRLKKYRILKKYFFNRYTR